MPDALPKIDVHAHILPREWPDLKARYGYGGWISLEHHEPGRAKMMRDGTFFREIEANCYDPAVRLKDLDAMGLAMQALCTVPVMFGYWAHAKDAADLARILNDDLAETCRTYPDRYVGLGTLPMQDPDLSIRELERCMGELGMKGIQIGSHVNKWNLDAPEIVAVLEAAADLDAAVLIHPWDMLGRDRMARYWMPWLVGMPCECALAICSLIFGGVFEKLPKLRVCVAHGGGAFPFTLGRIEHGFNVRPDLVAINNDRSPREYIGRFFVDTGVHDELAMKFLFDLFGSENICLGSDAPFPLGEHQPGQLVESMNFSAADTHAMLVGSPAAFLGIPEPAAAPGAGGAGA